MGGGKHQLIFNAADMSDEGEIKCESGKLFSSCKLTVKKGESKPIIKMEGDVEGPCSKPILFEVPYAGTAGRTWGGQLRAGYYVLFFS